jgi:hypothetical protein
VHIGGAAYFEEDGIFAGEVCCGGGGTEDVARSFAFSIANV